MLFRLSFFFLVALASAAAPLETEVSTVAGIGLPGFSGDGGLASQAKLNNPFGVIKTPDGTIYFCDTGNHRIRKISSSGQISTVAGNGERGYNGDGGPALKAALNEPYEVRMSAEGELYFVEMRNHLVRKVDKAGIITTIAGSPQQGFSGDGGPPASARFNQPHSIQFDGHGSLYICDIGNHRLRRIDSKGKGILTLSGNGEKAMPQEGQSFSNAPMHGPRAVDFSSTGELWLALREGNAICRLDLQRGTFHREAGSGKKSNSPFDPQRDGVQPAGEASLYGPKGIAIGPEGHVYFADTESHTIRRLNRSNKTVELVAGTGQAGDGPDGPGTKSKLQRPHGVFVDGKGDILVGDSEAHKLRVIRIKSR